MRPPSSTRVDGSISVTWIAGRDNPTVWSSFPGGDKAFHRTALLYLIQNAPGVPFPELWQPHPFQVRPPKHAECNGEYKLSKGEKASHILKAGVPFINGHWETVKRGSYPISSLGSEDKREEMEAEYTSPPNNFQLPAYFLMDVGYHLILQGKKYLHDLSLGI